MGSAHLPPAGLGPQIARGHGSIHPAPLEEPHPAVPAQSPHHAPGQEVSSQSLLPTDAGASCLPCSVPGCPPVPGTDSLPSTASRARLTHSTNPGQSGVISQNVPSPEMGPWSPKKLPPHGRDVALVLEQNPSSSSAKGRVLRPPWRSLSNASLSHPRPQTPPGWEGAAGHPGRGQPHSGWESGEVGGAGTLCCLRNLGTHHGTPGPPSHGA